MECNGLSMRAKCGNVVTQLLCWLPIPACIARNVLYSQKYKYVVAAMFRYAVLRTVYDPVSTQC